MNRSNEPFKWIWLLNRAGAAKEINLFQIIIEVRATQHTLTRPGNVLISIFCICFSIFRWRRRNDRCILLWTILKCFVWWHTSSYWKCVRLWLVAYEPQWMLVEQTSTRKKNRLCHGYGRLHSISDQINLYTCVFFLFWNSKWVRRDGRIGIRRILILFSYFATDAASRLLWSMVSFLTFECKKCNSIARNGGDNIHSGKKIHFFSPAFWIQFKHAPTHHANVCEEISSHLFWLSICYCWRFRAFK